jgi:hypothetical protein
MINFGNRKNSVAYRVKIAAISNEILKNGGYDISGLLKHGKLGLELSVVFN